MPEPPSNRINTPKRQEIKQIKSTTLRNRDVNVHRDRDLHSVGNCYERPPGRDWAKHRPGSAGGRERRQHFVCGRSVVGGISCSISLPSSPKRGCILTCRSLFSSARTIIDHPCRRQSSNHAEPEIERKANTIHHTRGSLARLPLGLEIGHFPSLLLLLSLVKRCQLGRGGGEQGAMEEIAC